MVQGPSAGNLLQGPQGRLQGHIHSVADGFRVVWHRVTGALEGGRRYIDSAKIHHDATGGHGGHALYSWVFLGHCSSCPSHPRHWFVVLGHETEGVPLPLESSPLSTEVPSGWGEALQ